MRARNPIALRQTAGLLGLGFLQAWALIGRLKPAAVIGFGGYPTIPPVLAGVWRGVPSLIHDANAVIGRANRLLAPRVSAIATTFPDMFSAAPAFAAKATLTGNPVRAAVVVQLQYLMRRSATRSESWSLAAAKARASWPMSCRPRSARSIRSCGHGSPLRSKRAMRIWVACARPTPIRVAAETASFFADLPARIAASHLVIGRSGASTVAELSAIGRPSILVPLPGAIDQDQFANAGVLERAGGAIRITQDGFTPDRLATELTSLANGPQHLVAMAAAAQSLGRLDAADRLADLVLRVAATAR